MQKDEDKDNDTDSTSKTELPPAGEAVSAPAPAAEFSQEQATRISHPRESNQETSKESAEVKTSFVSTTADSADVPGATATQRLVPEENGAEITIKDRFVLQEKLGKGGMGEVYRALDLRKQELDDDQPFVAVKFLGQAFGEHPQALVSLQREAKKTQALAHPNIVTVYDFDRDGPNVYMTMELLEGESLSDWNKGRLIATEKTRLVAIVTELANALEYAHRKGVIHSDLKPENVFLTAKNIVKILDFGIARIADQGISNDSFDARSLGALTPRYASLEMLERETDAASADDIYALGLMVYELYTGKHPFDGLPADTALERKLKPKRPKEMGRQQWIAVEKALRFRRADRTQEAGEFLHVFSGSRRRRRFVLASVLLLLMSSAFFAYQVEKEKGPSIPFSELPASVQLELSDKLSMASQFLAIGDLDGASRYFIESWQLHPRNPDTQAGLDTIVEQLESRVEMAKTQREQEFLLSFLNAHADHPYFARSDAFRDLQQRLAKTLN